MAQKRIEYYGKFTPTGVDTSQAKRLQALSGLAEQVGGLAYGVASDIAERRGLQAGLAAGQEAAEKGEIIETQKGFLSQISIFDQAYNNALTKAYVAGVDNDARESINRLLTDNPQQKVNVLGVALDSGFNSKSAFYTAFKKVTAMTPTQYRNTV